MASTDYSAQLDAARTDLGLLNSDELEVARYFISKILRGKIKHGALNLDTDGRDWQAESCEERVDDAAYSIMAIIQRDRVLSKGWPTAPLTLGDADADRAAIEGFELDLDVAECGLI